jgi:hypothetical protein
MRKFSLTVLVLFLVGFAARAEFIHNPDENTLWIENGKNIAVDEKRAKRDVWGGGLPVKERGKGGFSFVFNTAERKKYSNGIYVPVDPDYPFLVFEILAFKRLQWKHRGFRFGAFQHSKRPCFFMVDNPQSGIIVYNVFGDEKIHKGYRYVRNDMDGLQVDFKYVKMVKKPDNYIIIESEAIKKNKVLANGDEVKFTVILKEPAEDVSLRFFRAYLMRQLNLNGKDHLQLKPENEDSCKVWSAKVKIKSLYGNRLGAGQLLVKAVVLGGGINVPIWTPLMSPYKACKAKGGK